MWVFFLIIDIIGYILRRFCDDLIFVTISLLILYSFNVDNVEKKKRIESIKKRKSSVL